MGKVILGVGANSFSVVYGGTTITDYVRQATITMSSDRVEITGMGSTAHTYAPGLRDDNIQLEVFQDYGVVDSLINTWLGSSSGATLVVSSSGSTVSSSYPKWTLIGNPYDYQPVDGTVGEASTTTITFYPATGTSITRGTS